MLTILIEVAVWAIILLIIVRLQGWDTGCIFMVIGAIALVLAIPNSLSFLASNQYTTTSDQELSRNMLVALDNSQQPSGGIAGSFLLVSGELSSRTYYSYWYRDGQSLRHGQLTDEDRVFIYEDSSPDNSYVVHLKQFTQIHCEKVDPLWGYCKEALTEVPGTGLWEFHVPIGTVVRQIQLQ